MKPVVSDAEPPEPDAPAPTEKAVPSPRPTTGVISVRVVDEHGAPLPYPHVKLRHYRTGRVFAEEETRYEEGSEEGEFVFLELEPGQYGISVWREETSYAVKHVELAAGGRHDILLSTSPAAYVEGTAYLIDRSTLLPNASLSRGRSVVETDPQGRFVVGPFLSGHHFFQLRYRDFQVETILVDPRKVRPAHRVDVVFRPGSTVAGLVSTPLGQPVPGVQVSWHREHTPEAERLRTTSDSTGRYELDGLRPGKHFVRVEGLGYEARPTIEVTVPEGSSQEVPLVVDCAPTFEVSVEDDAGEPLPGVEVRLRFKVQFHPRLPRVSGGWELVTGEDGTASAPCVPRGIRVDLSVEDRVLRVKTCPSRSSRPSTRVGPSPDE